MPATFVLSALISSSMLLAQGTATDRLVGLARGPGGEALAQAEVHFYPAAASDYPWLHHLLPVPAHTVAVSDLQGRFEITCNSVTGSVWIEHHDGLGGLHHGLGPGAAQVLTAHPLGEVRLASSRAFSAEILALPADAGSVYLGRRQGQALRLPAGSYLLLISSEGQRHEVPVQIRSAERSVIHLPDPTIQRVAGWSAQQGELYLDGWPTSLAAAAGKMFLPQPSERSLLRWHRALATATWIEEIWYQRGEIVELPSTPVQTHRFKVTDEANLPLAGVRVCSVESTSARVMVRSWALTDAAGEVDLASHRQHRETYVIALSPGYGPAVLVQDDGSQRMALRLSAGSHARVRILDPRGMPLAGTRVEIWQQPASLLHRVSYSDARGEVRFQDLTSAAANLRVDHQDYLPLEFTMTTRKGAAGPFVSVQLESGLELSGRVVDNLQQPIAGAVVELRGAAAFNRIQATDATGHFLFRGLPEAQFTVFVQTTVAGITWSGRALGLSPGQAGLQIVVASEDPHLPDKK